MQMMSCALWWIKWTPPITFLYILMTSGRGTWIFDANPFCRWRAVDAAAILSALINRIVTEHLSNHLEQATLSEYKYSIKITSLYLSVKRHPHHSFSYPFGQCQYHTSLKSLIKLHYKWGTVEEIIRRNMNWLFWRDSGPRFFSELSFLSKCKTNW